MSGTELWKRAIEQREADQDPVRTTMAKLEDAGLVDLAIRCAEVSETTTREMLARTHRRAPSMARSLLYACMREIDHVRWSYTELGALFGRDHTTIMTQCKRAPEDEVSALLFEHEELLLESQHLQDRAAERRRMKKIQIETDAVTSAA